MPRYIHMCTTRKSLSAEVSGLRRVHNVGATRRRGPSPVELQRDSATPRPLGKKVRHRLRVGTALGEEGTVGDVYKKHSATRGPRRKGRTRGACQWGPPCWVDASISPRKAHGEGWVKKKIRPFFSSPRALVGKARAGIFLVLPPYPRIFAECVGGRRSAKKWREEG